MLFGKRSDKNKNRGGGKANKNSDEDSGFFNASDGDTVGIGSGLDEETIESPAPGRPKVMSITIKDRKTLHAAYLPFVEMGGIFVPSSSSYKMGEEVFLLLKLLDSPENISVPGSIVWITPQGAVGNRVAGIGIQFTGPEAGKVRSKIEGILGGALQSRRMTHTM